jgi:hypothetical protein
MQYSPKLKKAMQEIKDILSKHDIAGIVVIHTPGHTEFLNKLNPTYSCCKINGDQIRVKAKLEDFNGNKQARNKVISDTANMLHSISMVTGKMLMPLIDLSQQVDKIIDASHNGEGFSSHTTQNN